LRALAVHFSFLAIAFLAAARSSPGATAAVAPPGGQADGRRHLELCLQSPATNRGTAHCWYALNHTVPFARELDEAEARLRVAADYIAQGNDSAAWPLLDRAIRILSTQSGSKESLSEALAARGQIHLRRWEFDEGREDLTSAAALAREAAKPRLEAALLMLLSRLDLGVGRPKAAEEHLEKILENYGAPSPQLEADFRDWIKAMGSIMSSVNAAITQLALESFSGDNPGRSSTAPVDDVEVDYLLHFKCLRFGGIPEFKETLCEGSSARQRIVDELGMAHDVTSVVGPLVKNPPPSLKAGTVRFCPLFERNEVLFDLADLNELSGNAALADDYRRKAKELWRRTSGLLIRQQEDAVMEMAWNVGRHYYPEKVRPKAPDNASSPLMESYEAEERPTGVASQLGCARGSSISSLRQPTPGDLATMPNTLQDRLINGYESLSLPPAMAVERAKMAREAVKAGDNEAALALYQEALELAESRVTDPVAVSVDLAARTSRLYGEFIRFLVDTGHYDLAFNVSERARYLAFNDSIRADLPRIRSRHAEALASLRQLDRQIASLQGDIQSRKASAPPEYPPMLGGLNDELRRLIAERDLRISRLRALDPETTALYYGETVDLPAVRESILPPDTTMITYFLTREDSLAWVIEGDAVQFFRLRTPPAEIESLVKNFQNALLDRSQQPQEGWKSLSEQLYEVLLRPLEPSLHHPNVIIVPHGILHTLPFAALMNSRSGRFAGEERTLSTTPSATALKFLGRHVTPLNGRLLAFGDPDGSLPFAAKEVKAIAAIFGATPVLGAEATPSRLQQEGSAADIIHLAVHSHREEDAGGLLELAPKGTAGFLRARDILRMSLTETNLVVLSACDTAAGPVAAGDSMATLNRAFLIAGSPTVLATLWPVADDASSALMTSFYRHLRESPSRGYPDALQRAQQDVRTEPRWASPYYWAGFMVNGDVGRAASAVSRPGNATTATPSQPPGGQPSQQQRHLLEERFEDNRNHWYESMDPVAPATIRGGRYLFGSKPNEWRFATTGVSLPASGDFELHATVTKVRGDDRFFFGLIWELNDDQNFSNFAITGDGRVAVTRKRAGGFMDFIDTSSPNPAVNRGNARNELRVTRKAGTVKFFANGVEIYTMSDRPAFGAAVGFLVYGDVLLSCEELTASEAP
jgi:CHAT domain-containing protein